ncbi:uncharacterized protein LOC129241311 [Anastrepha obliqua]|uniref:uncharacterized protein LOC129241311 n=1 Tax=Anastrepha obliqua TaxID=95512 RepID=UPI0024095BC9|nr:uncharacterized protein LOC129241311 [Anastrepha obliqua]
MYHEVVPEFEQLYRAVGVEVNFSAKCYHIETPSEFGVILLEELCPFGYTNANHLEGLNLEHTKAVLERLAQWHAASAVRAETKGLYPELFLKGMFSEFTESQQGSMKAYYDTFKPSLFESIRSLNGHEEYIDDLAQAFDSKAKESTRGSHYEPSEFNALNHGDCWVNNVMFKYDSQGNIEDTLLIDYQMINYGSPAKDLIYFLLSSTICDLKVKQFDYSIRFYHDHLVKNLQLLEYSKNLPTLKEIHIAVMKYGNLALITALGIMAVALLEPRSDAMFTNPRYRKHLEVIMPWMSNRGVFEVGR